MQLQWSDPDGAMALMLDLEFNDVEELCWIGQRAAR